MSPHGTVLSTLPKVLLGHLGAMGHDEAAVAREAGLDPAAWQEDDDARVAREGVDALFDIAERLTSDGAFGAKLALALPPGNAGVFETVTHSARSVEDGLRHVCRYWHLLNDGVDLDLAKSETEATLTLQVRSKKPLARGWTDLTAVVLAVVGARLVARPRPPSRIFLPYPRDRWSSETEALLPAPVRYDAPALSLVYPLDLLAEKLTGANASLHRVAVDLAEEQLQEHRRSAQRSTTDLEGDVLRAIAERLENGDANLENVAVELGVRPRTLQRKLSASKTSLRALLDRARKDVALREIARGSRSVTDIAFLLGFSETSAFDRAFRRWTGMSPVQYRALHRASA